MIPNTELEYDLTKTIYYKKNIPAVKNSLFSVIELLKSDPKCSEYVVLFENYYKQNYHTKNISKCDILHVIYPNQRIVGCQTRQKIDYLLNLIKNLIELPQICECCISFYHDTKNKPCILKCNLYICGQCVFEHKIYTCNKCDRDYCKTCDVMEDIFQDHKKIYCTECNVICATTIPVFNYMNL